MNKIGPEGRAMAGTKPRMEIGSPAALTLGQQKRSRKYDAALRAVEGASDPGAISAVAKLLEAAHTAGDRRATYALGTWHFHGTFFAKDEKRGFLLMLVAADGFIADACFDVAVSYETGLGVRKNRKKAGVYYLRAMMLGCNGAVEEVGRLFYWGIGFEKNHSIAMELLNFRTPGDDIGLGMP